MLQEVRVIRSSKVDARAVIEFRYNLANKSKPPTQTYMAEVFGISQSSWSEWENSGIPKGPASKLFRLIRQSVYLKRNEQ